MTNGAARGDGAIRVGTAGWAIPRDVRDRFPSDGTLLQRYASLLDCVEINSSFYRPHRPSTYERWALSVPASFRFSLKMPKEITHVRRCIDCDVEVRRFVDETDALGEKRGMLLIQLPPSFVFADRAIGEFFSRLRDRYDGFAVCEPRHASWFAPKAAAMLCDFRIGRVAADPPLCAEAERPGGWSEIAYYRLHGSPNAYYSRYEFDEVRAVAARLSASSASERWCIFDNTASGAALSNALEMRGSDCFGGSGHGAMQTNDDDISDG